MNVAEPGGYRSTHIHGDNHGVVVTGDSNSVHVDLHQNTDPGQHLANGKHYLRLGLHAKALAELRQAMGTEDGDAEVCHLSAIAVLGGRKPILASLTQIREAENLIRAAIALDPRGIFFYFLAYLAFDYYERKSLRAPAPARTLLLQAWHLGVTPSEIASLFTALSVQNPLPTHP